MSTLRVETIFVVAVLLLLLLQLPRVDDPPELRLVGGEITRVQDVRGAALYVGSGDGEIDLVYVTELRMHQDPSGTAYVTKLQGVILEDGRESGSLCIDATARASALGWRPVLDLDGLGLPGNRTGLHPYELRRLRLRKVIHEGRNVLLVVGRVEGLDLVTGRVVSADYDVKTQCPAVPLLEFAAVSGVSASSGTGGEDRFLALTGTLCWRDANEAPLRSSLAWTAGYRYQ